jgi:hypothetical protein
MKKKSDPTTKSVRPSNQQTTKGVTMPSNIDVQKVVRALHESKAVNLDLTLGQIVASPAVGLINSVANLEPWELICYTWVTFLRRRFPGDLVLPVDRQIADAGGRGTIG